MPEAPIEVEAAGRKVAITNPGKVFFPERGYTKLDLVNYYLAVADGALRGIMRRPMVLKRYPNGADQEPFFQKRAPANLPDGIETAHITFPSGRTADLVVCDDAADLVWAVNLGCLDLNPWAVRANDVDHPDELRVDLDPTPEATFARRESSSRSCSTKCSTSLATAAIPRRLARAASTSTSASNRSGTSPKCVAGALALGREVERRVPALATTKWWKEERHGVFIDYNQNARDRTVASAYSIRPTPDARVSCPLEWSEVAGCELADFTLLTVPKRYAEIGDPGAGIDEHAHSLEPLLDLVAKQEAHGEGDAPWPPHFPKAATEPARVQPSKRRRPASG